MLRDAMIRTGTMVLVGLLHTTLAVDHLQVYRSGDRASPETPESTTWSVCSAGCDFSSIQQAVDAAAGGDVLSLGAETFYETIVIAKDLVIAGVGPGQTVLDGMYTTTVVRILGASDTTRASNVTLRNLTIRRGSGGSGGGVAIGRDSRLVIEGCEIENNNAEYAGGGIMAFFADVQIADSVIRDNASYTWGGGIYLEGRTLSLLRSTVVGNSGAFGGGIYNYPTSPGATAGIANSTISRNLGDFEGGGIVCGGGGRAWSIQDTTITGTLGVGLSGCGETVVGNSIISGSSRGDCIGSPISAGHNLTSDTSCGFSDVGDMEGVDPELEALADNGGSTPTHALASTSPAIDAGGDDCSSSDQRGVARPQDGNLDGVSECDIGAFEYEPAIVTISIDIKPDSYPNSVNPRARGVVPVAVLGSDTFDVADIDVTTLAFGPGGAPIAHRKGHMQDVDYDGIMDLMFHFRMQDTGIACGDESATLTGELVDSQSIEGSDSIRTVGCRVGRWLGIWMHDEEREVCSGDDQLWDVERK